MTTEEQVNAPSGARTSRPLNILFWMRHEGYTRNYEALLRLLAERGHRIRLAFDVDVRSKDTASQRIVHRLRHDYPSVTVSRTPNREGERWASFAKQIRCVLDYLRYLGPSYRDAPKLRDRAEARLTPFFRLVTRLPSAQTPAGRAFLTRLLRFLAAAIPTDAKVSRFIRDARPDILLITPLVELASGQSDVIRSAKALGLRTGACIASWDNLTNKGLIHDLPDLVAVWNAAQKREAVELHGIPAERVVVTGAVAYDHWFDWVPSTTREEFCHHVGLRSSQPYFLYVCSSPFIAPDETSFVLDWVRGIRTAEGGCLREIGILVRPHPQNATQWLNVEFAGLDNFVVWPRGGANPVDADAKSGFYDSMYHCAAVVGVNTSALIESAIVGRSVYTVLAPEFRDTQEGTLHFHHLLHINGGLLHVASSFEEHAAQLAEALTPDPKNVAQNKRFVEAFVRPHGIEKPATPVLADAIEEVCARPAPPPLVPPLWAKMLRMLLTPIVWLAVLVQANRRMRSRFAHTAKRISLRGLRRSFKIPRVRKYIGHPFLRLAWTVEAELATFDKKAVGKGRSQLQTKRRTPLQRAVIRPARSENPVVAGPWLGDTGSELLYWIPFLNWAVAARPQLAERLIIIARPGTAAWYRHLTPQLVDVLDLVNQTELGMLQQRQLGQLGQADKESDAEFQARLQELANKLRDKLSLGEIETLPPSALVQHLRQLQRDNVVSQILTNSVYQPMARPELSALGTRLPEAYVVAHFSYSPIFPDTEQNRAFIARVITALTRKSDVILLESDTLGAEYADIAIPWSNRLHRLNHLMPHHTDLSVQTVAISQARAFVGTCGSLSYVSPYFGVPSLCFFSDRLAMPSLQQELEVAQRLFGGIYSGRLLALDTKHVDVLQFIADINDEAGQTTVRDVPMPGRV